MFQKFNPDLDECMELATTIFLKTAGLNKEGRKFDRMRNAAMKIREGLTPYIEINAAWRYSKDIMFDHDEVVIDGQKFKCRAFEQIDPKTIKGAYVYAMTAGTYSCPDEPVMEQLYMDIWGTSLTDAVRILLKREFEKGNNLSDNFGPGFYGMELSEIRKIDTLIDLKQLGIKLYENNIMVPLKACAGLYFAVDDTYEKIGSECLSCRGNHTSCQLCQIRQNVLAERAVQV